MISYILEILFLCSAVFALIKLYTFYKKNKITATKSLFTSVFLLNTLITLITSWYILKGLGISKDEMNVFSLKFIFDTITYFIELSVPVSLFAFSYVLTNKSIPKFNFRFIILPSIFMIAPKAAAWLEIAIVGTSHILKNLYTLADFISITAILAISIYMAYKAYTHPVKKFKQSLKILSLIYVIPFSLFFFSLTIFPSILNTNYLKIISAINLSLYVIFNWAIIIWIGKMGKDFADYLAGRNSDELSKLDSFAATYGITKRESEIVALIIKGETNKAIADKLFISLSTVKDHNYKIYQKLEVKNRTQLAKLYNDFLTD